MTIHTIKDEFTGGRGVFPREEKVTRRFTEEHKTLFIEVIREFVRLYGEHGPHAVPLDGRTMTALMDRFGFQFDDDDTKAQRTAYANVYMREPSDEILRRLDLQTIYDLNIIRMYRWRGKRLTNFEDTFPGLSAKRATSKAARWHLLVGE